MRWILPALSIGALLWVAGSASAADLSPSWIQIDATDTPPTVNPTIRITVRNLDGSAAAASSVRIYADLNNNGVFNSGVDEDLGTKPVPALAANDGAMGGADEAVITYNLPFGYAFTYGIGLKKVFYATADSAGAVSESNENNNVNFAYQVRKGVNAPVPPQQRVLFIDFNAYYPGHMDNTRTNLANGSNARVTDFQPTYDGHIQATLEAAESAGDPYDQVWWAANSSTINLTNDFHYLREWLTSRPSWDLVFDGGFLNSGGYSPQGYNSHAVAANDQTAYLANIYHNFRIRGGGLLTGTDHHNGSNPSNSSVSTTGYSAVNHLHDILGVGRYWGNFGTAGYRCTTDTNPLRTVPYLLNNSHYMESTPGKAPTGFQGPGGSPMSAAAAANPLNATLFTLSTYYGGNAACDGSGDAQPAISTTISGTLGYALDMTADCGVSEPAATNILEVTAGQGVTTPITYTWTSSIDGAIRSTVGTNSTTDSYDGANLSAGIHTISVTAMDANNFVAGAQMFIHVGGPDCDANCVPDFVDIVDVNQNSVPDQCELLLFDVSPTTVPLGYEGPIALSGSSFTNDLQLNLGPDVAVLSVEVSSDNDATAVISVGPGTPIGDLAVGLDNGLESQSFSGLLEVLLSAPTLAGATPNWVSPESTTTLTLQGANLPPSTAVSADVGSTGAQTFVSLSELTVSYTAPATPQLVTLTATTAAGQVTTGIGVFGLTGVTGAALTPGSSGSVSATGVGFTGDEVVSLGTGITLSDLVITATTISATATAGVAAPLGPRDLTVSNPTLATSHSLPGGATVSPASGGGGDGPPVASGCTPATYQGRNYSVCPVGASWDTARSNCQAASLDLAVVSHAAEGLWLDAQLDPGASGWIGLRDSGAGYAWVNGGNGGYSAWGAGQPASATSCAHGASAWGTAGCAESRPYVCEGTTLPVTELVSLWLFDDGEGATALDASGNGFHGAVSGAASWWLASTLDDELGGTTGAALRFGADGGQVIGLPAYAATAAFTLEAWVELDSLPVGGAVPFGMSVGATTYATIHSDGLGGATFQCAAATDVDFAVATAPFGAAADWQHVACVWDGTTLTAYVDAVASSPVPLVGTHSVTSNHWSLTGKLASIDQAAYWSVALDQATLASRLTGPGVTDGSGDPVGEPFPAVGSCTPERLGPGQGATITVVGANFTAGATFDFGPGVTVTGVVAIDATQCLVSIAIAPGASLGYRNVRITTPYGTAVLPQGLRLFGITSMGPSVAQAGASGVDVLLSGYGFTATDSFDFGSGVSVVSAQLLSSTECLVTVDIAANAILGNRDVVVSGAGGASFTLSGVFTVSGPDVIVWTTTEQLSDSTSTGIDLASSFGGAILAASNNTHVCDFTDGVWDAGLGTAFGPGQVSFTEGAGGLSYSGYGGGCVHAPLPQGLFDVFTSFRVDQVLSDAAEIFGFGPGGGFLPGLPFTQVGFAGLFVTQSGGIGCYYNPTAGGGPLYWDGSGWTTALTTFASGGIGVNFGVAIRFDGGNATISLTNADTSTLVGTIGGIALGGIFPSFYLGTVAEFCPGGVPQVVTAQFGGFSVVDPLGLFDGFGGPSLGGSWGFGSGSGGGSGYSFGGGGVRIQYDGGGHLGTAIGHFSGGGGSGGGWRIKSRLRVRNGGGGGLFGLFGFGNGAGLVPGGLGSAIGSYLFFDPATGSIGWCYNIGGGVYFWDGASWGTNYAVIPGTSGSLGNWFDIDCVHDGNGLTVNVYNAAGVLVTSILNVPGLSASLVDLILGSISALDGLGGSATGEVEFDFLDMSGNVQGRGFTTSGTLTIDPHDAGSPSNWGVLGIGSRLPAGTSLRLQLRCANSLEDLLSQPFLGPDGTTGTWFTGGELIDAPFDGYRFIQWTCDFHTDDPEFSPELYDIIIELQALPTITNIAPTFGRRGETVTVTIDGTTFDTATSVSFLPATELTINSLTLLSQNQVEVDVTLDADAVVGPLDVQLSTSAGSTLSDDGFGVAGITGLNTPGGEQGATLAVSLSGFALASPYTLDFGTGVTVDSAQLIGTAQIDAVVSVDTSAALGARDVTYTEGGVEVTLPGAFEVFPAAGCVDCTTLGLTTVNPPVVATGTPQTLTLQGTGFGTDLQVVGSAGVQVTSIQVLSINQATVVVEVDPNCGCSQGGLTLSRDGQQVEVTNAFAVLNLQSLSTTTLPAGQSTTFTVTGSGFVAGQTLSVTLGAGIVASATALDATHLQVQANVSAGAILGARTLSVTVGGATATWPAAMSVTGAGGSAPSISAITPFKGVRGTSVPVTLNGAKFAYGMTLSLGVGVVVSNMVIVSPTQATCTLNIAGGAAPGVRPVDITTQFGTASLISGFLVQENPCQGVFCNSPPTSCHEATGTCDIANGDCDYAPLAAGTACTDNVACTEGTTCDGAGVCGTANHGACNDGFACTDDICDPVDGCLYESNSPECDDYACTTGGDLNGSSTLNVSDVICCALVAHAIQLATPAPACLKGDQSLADINCNNTVNVADVQLLVGLAIQVGLPEAVDLNANTCVDACEQLDCGDASCTGGEDCVLCGVDCGNCTGDCCITHGTPGCNNPTVQECVCDLEETCCHVNYGWSQGCVDLALNSCGLTCN